jgi:hypothetical protein
MGATPIRFLKVILFRVMGEKREVVIIFLLIKGYPAQDEA